MERWDAYDRDGNPTGGTLVRGEQIPAGLYHLVCEILVRHRDGDYLLMQRDLCKQGFPGAYEAAAGGSALQREDVLTCARRELLEETGIAAEELISIGYYVSDNTLYHQFLCVTGCNKASVRLQEGETMGYAWVSEKQFRAFIRSDRAISTQMARYEPYFRQLGYLP